MFHSISTLFHSKLYNVIIPSFQNVKHIVLIWICAIEE